MPPKAKAGWWAAVIVGAVGMALATGSNWIDKIPHLRDVVFAVSLAIALVASCALLLHGLKPVRVAPIARSLESGRRRWRQWQRRQERDELGRAAQAWDLFYEAAEKMHSAAYWMRREGLDREEKEEEELQAGFSSELGRHVYSVSGFRSNSHKRLSSILRTTLTCPMGVSNVKRRSEERRVFSAGFGSRAFITSDARKNSASSRHYSSVRPLRRQLVKRWLGRAPRPASWRSNSPSKTPTATSSLSRAATDGPS